MHCVYVCTLTVIGVFLSDNFFTPIFGRKATITCSSHDIIGMVAWFVSHVSISRNFKQVIVLHI